MCMESHVPARFDEKQIAECSPNSIKADENDNKSVAVARRGVTDERWRSNGCSRGSRTLHVWVEDDIMDAEVEGVEALLPAAREAAKCQRTAPRRRTRRDRWQGRGGARAWLWRRHTRRRPRACTLRGRRRRSCPRPLAPPSEWSGDRGWGRMMDGSRWEE